jgi:hypothetical protein
MQESSVWIFRQQPWFRRDSLAVACKGFNLRGTSTALGAIVGLDLLVKWSCFVFVIPVIIVELAQNRRIINTRKLILIEILAAAMSPKWYANALAQGLIQKLLHYAWADPPKSTEGHPPTSPVTETDFPVRIEDDTLFMTIP